MARRPNAHPHDGSNQYEAYYPEEAENDHLIYGLKDKVTTLKSLTLDMGDEIKYQNKYLQDVDKDFDSTWGMLSSNMNRVKRIAKSGGCKFYMFLLLFSLFALFLMYMMFFKFR